MVGSGLACKMTRSASKLTSCKPDPVALLIYAAVHTIAFELGLRFLTDYLAGNVYFKVHHEGENLHRALVQFHLVLSIEQRKPQIEMLVKGG